jgi:alpha-N-arabinofuranosidase
MLNNAWGMPEYNQFGTDEFLRFCELVGAEPQIALNLGTGTPEEAASWVEYVNAHWGDHRGGLLWELGNELWGTFQIGYPTPSGIGDRTKAFADAVRKVDPRARLIATGADPDNFHDWNAEQLNKASSSFQYLSTHFVVTTGSTQTRDASADFIAKTTFALPVEVGRRLRKMNEQIQNSPARDSVKTAFTEWLFWAADDTYPRYDNMGGGVATGGFLNMLLRNADIVPISDMTGIIEFGGIWKKRSRVFGTPAYWIFRMYSNSDATTPVETTTDGETYNVTLGTTRLPSIDAVPYLDVVAALNDSGSKLTLFCVNRDLTRDLRADFNIAGFRAKPNAVSQSVYADSIYEKNDEMHPEHIHPQLKSFSPRPNGFECQFRHASVTVIQL